MPWPAKHFSPPDCEWSDVPLTYRCYWILRDSGAKTRQDIRDLGRKEWFKRHGLVGPKTMKELGRLIGGWPDEPPGPVVDYSKITREIVEG